MWLRLVLLIWWFSVNGQVDNRCSFPGIPFRARAASDDGELTWEKRRDFQIDQVVTFHCERGHQIPTDQSAAIVCLADGKWNASVPRCDRNSSWTEWPVQFYDTPQNGRCQWKDFIAAKELTGQKSEVFRLPVNAARISEVEVVTNLSRRIISQTENTRETRNDYPEVLDVTVDDSKCRKLRNDRSTCRFRCSHAPRVEGRNLAVNISLSFRAYLKSVTLLISDDSDCGIPPVPLHAVADFDVQQVRYNCTEGFQLDGNSSVACDVSTGQWTGIPLCRQLVSTLLKGLPTDSTRPATDVSSTGSQNFSVTDAKNGKFFIVSVGKEIIIAGVIIVLLVVLVAMALVLTKQQKLWCFRPTTTSTAGKRAADNEIYANINQLKVNEEPVYVELGPANPLASASVTDGENDGIYENTGLKQSKSSIPSHSLRPVTSDVIYASIQPRNV